MKTLAIALFASLALFGCATDDGQEIGPLDRDGEQRDVDSVTDGLDERGSDILVPDGVGIHEQGQRWAEELLHDNRLWTIVHGPRGAEALLDDLGNKVPAPQGIDALLEQLGLLQGRLDVKVNPQKI